MEISHNAARKVLERMFRTGEAPADIVRELKLEQMPLPQLTKIVWLTVCADPDTCLRYLEGETKLINTLVGKVMKETNGKASGSDVEVLIRACLQTIYGKFYGELHV